MSKIINNSKEQLIEIVLFRLSLNAAFQRNKIYKKKANKEEEKAFKEYLRLYMENWLSNTNSNDSYSDKDHYRAIVNLSNVISREFNHILARNSLKIGTSQKLLNVYWKANWIFRKGIKEPVHCPFDGIIIRKLPAEIKKVSWTKMKTIQQYKDLVKAARSISNGQSLAIWELVEYNKNGILKNSL
jgi:hypothetical protein